MPVPRWGTALLPAPATSPSPSSSAGRLQVRADPAMELRPHPLPLLKGQHQPLKEELQLQRHSQ